MTTQIADIVLYNASVLTMPSKYLQAELIAIKDGMIVWVGANDDLNTFSSGAGCIDCHGQTVVPGFNDAHIHILGFASKLLSIDCSPEAVSSIADIYSRIRNEAERLSSGTWIKASGYNEFYLKEHRHPTRHDLDQAAPHHPVKLTHRSLHACVLNSKALSLANINIETPDPPGGMIDRELDSGEPSGLLFGMNSYINESIVPPLGDEELKRGVELVNEELLSLGITSIQDASVRNGIDQWHLFGDMKKKGRLIPRVNMMFGAHALADLQECGMYSGFGDTELRAGPMKVVIDEVSGRLNPTLDELTKAVTRAHEGGFQVALHAVEEGTVDAAVSALESCLKRSPKPDHRHRIEHCSVCPPSLLERLNKIGAIVVTQPAFIFHNGERYLNEVSNDQLRWLYRTRSFLQNGLRPAGSSDCPVIPCNPLTGIYAAVTRRTEQKQIVSSDEAVSVYDALDMYTCNAAYASFEENIKGSIEVGKVADLVILSADPTEVDVEEIREIMVEKTIVGGDVVWERR